MMRELIMQWSLLRNKPIFLGFIDLILKTS